MHKKSIIISTIILIVTTSILAFSPWNWSLFKNTPVYNQSQLQQRYDSGYSQGLADHVNYTDSLTKLKLDIQTMLNNINHTNDAMFEQLKNKQDYMDKISLLQQELELASQEGYADSKITEIEQEIDNIKSELYKLEQLKNSIVIITYPSDYKIDSNGNYIVQLDKQTTEAYGPWMRAPNASKQITFTSYGTPGTTKKIEVKYWALKISPATRTNWQTGETTYYAGEEHIISPDGFDYTYSPSGRSFAGKIVEFIPHFDLNVEYVEFERYL